MLFLKNSLVILIITIPFIVFSQTKTETIEIGKNSVFQGLFQTEDSGFVMVTGKSPKYDNMPNTKYENINMVYFNSNMDEVWRHSPEFNFLSEYFVSSNLTDVKYYFTYIFEEGGKQGKNLRNSSFKLNYTQFDKSGIVEKGDVNIKESNANYNLIAAFMDKDKLYLLNNNIMPDDKNTESEKPSLNYINHLDKSNTGKIILNINLTKGGTFGFIGFFNNEIYLYQHTAENRTEIQTKIFRLDLKGNLINEFKIINKCSKGYRFKDLSYERSYIGNCIINPLKNPKAWSYVVNLNALIEIKADFKSGNFYFIGMEVENKNLQSSIYTFDYCYMSKCSLDGENFQQKELNFNNLKSGNNDNEFKAKNYYYIDIQDYEEGKFIIYLKDGNNILEYSLVVSMKDLNSINPPAFRINNNPYLLKYKQGVFSVISVNKTNKNKSFSDYVSSFEKKDIKENSLLVLNAGKKYFIIKHYNKDKSTFIDLLFFK